MASASSGARGEGIAAPMKTFGDSPFHSLSLVTILEDIEVVVLRRESESSTNHCENFLSSLQGVLHGLVITQLEDLLASSGGLY